MYVIFYDDEYDYGFYGVFDTKEKAREAIKKEWKETDDGYFCSFEEYYKMFRIEKFEKNKLYP